MSAGYEEAMKRLLILRHAKSGLAQQGGDDFDRPLSPRGRRAAPAIGRHMSSLGYRPDIVLCSPAVRTRQTWDLVRAELDVAPIEEFRSELYLAEAKTLLDAIRRCEDRSGCVLVIAHNPGILTLALGLVGRGVKSANPFGKYPTGALTVFDFDCDRWEDIRPGEGQLVDYTRPKDIDSNA